MPMDKFQTNLKKQFEEINNEMKRQVEVLDLARNTLVSLKVKRKEIKTTHDTFCRIGQVKPFIDFSIDFVLDYEKESRRRKPRETSKDVEIIKQILKGRKLILCQVAREARKQDPGTWLSQGSATTSMHNALFRNVDVFGRDEKTKEWYIINEKGEK